MTTERKHWRLPRLMITGLALLAGIAALSFQMQPRATAEPPSGQWLAVQPSNLEHRIGLVGRIEPERTVSINAPFGGNIASNLVEPGQRVIKGERLLSMDASELEVQVRDALSTLLKARRIVRELQDWEAGQEVSRARRALRSRRRSCGRGSSAGSVMVRLRQVGRKRTHKKSDGGFHRHRIRIRLPG